MARPLTAALVALLLWALPAQAAAPSPAEDALKKGNALVQAGNLEGAVDIYRKAAAAYPKNARIHLALGLALANKGDSLEAAHHLRESADLVSSYQAWYSLGLVQANQNLFDKAIEAYRRALVENPRAYKAWYQLGLVYQAKGDFAAASEAFGNAVKMNPNYPEAYLGLASAAYWAGNVDGARDQVSRLKALKFADQAAALDAWIEKKEQNKKATASPAAA